jgi:hypothetical protein
MHAAALDNYIYLKEFLLVHTYAIVGHNEKMNVIQTVFKYRLVCDIVIRINIDLAHIHLF